MASVPAELEAALYRAAAKVVGDAALKPSALAKAIVDRSARYTSDRDRLAAPRDPTGDLAARACFFTIADAMKVSVPVAELAARDAIPARRPLRVIDLGAGCGAMTLGLAAALDIPLDVLAIDHDAQALAIAKAAVADFAGTRVTFTARPGDVIRAGKVPADETADLVVMGTLLNELPPDTALAVVERALAAVAADGAVIIVEPALRDTSRALHRIRDTVLARGTGHVFAPCTRRSAPCPALADERDWCHEDRPLVLPPRTAELARLTHLRDGGMKLSYLVLRRQPLDLVAGGDTAWRIVSAPMPEKGKLELIGCSAHGRIPLRLLKRNKTAANRDFERSDRGDVIVTTDTPGETRVEIRDGIAIVSCSRT